MRIIPPGKCWLLFSSPKKISIYRMGKQLFPHWLLSHGNYISRGKYFMCNSDCEQLCAPRQLLGCASVGMGSWCITHFLQTYLNWKKINLTKTIPLLLVKNILNFQIMRNYYISSSVNFVERLKADVSTFFKEHGKEVPDSEVCHFNVPIKVKRFRIPKAFFEDKDAKLLFSACLKNMEVEIWIIFFTNRPIPWRFALSRGNELLFY